MYEDRMRNREREQKRRVDVPNFKNEIASKEKQLNYHSYVRQYEKERYAERNIEDYIEEDIEEDMARNNINQRVREKSIKGERTKKERKKKLRTKRIRRYIGLCVLVLVSLIGGHVVGRFHAQVNHVLNKINRTSVTDLSTVNVTGNKLQQDKGIVNILLVGSDKRADWSEAGRSDSTMIGTLDTKNQRLKITSLMRDMYLTIPEHGEDKFNAAYSYGGVSLLYQTIAQNFGLKLDAYVVVDFDAFIKVINTIGGVKIELTDKEQEYLTRVYKKGSVLKLKKGVNNMNGAQALAYCRIRQDSKGDFGRTERQRKVLQSIFSKAKKMSYSQLLDLAGEVMPYISSDLSNDEIMSYLTSVIMMGRTEIDQMRIPLDNSYRDEKIGIKAVLIPDIEKNKQELHKFIFEYNGK